VGVLCLESLNHSVILGLLRMMFSFRSGAWESSNSTPKRLFSSNAIIYVLNPNLSTTDLWRRVQLGSAPTVIHVSVIFGDGSQRHIESPPEYDGEGRTEYARGGTAGQVLKESGLTIQRDIGRGSEDPIERTNELAQEKDILQRYIAS